MNDLRARFLAALTCADLPASEMDARLAQLTPDDHTAFSKAIVQAVVTMEPSILNAAAEMLRVQWGRV